MVVNAGAGVLHEESIPEAEEGGTGVEMLQVFVRPREAGLPPEVQFAVSTGPTARGGGAAWSRRRGSPRPPRSART